MYSKIQVTGTIEIVTGMHIGGNASFSAIGAVDSPVIKDIKSGLPLLPGSSVKGKMRSLLAKAYNNAVVEPDNDVPRITRLFGSAKTGEVKPSRLIFKDSVLNNEEELRRHDIISITEVKFENNINRQTAVANPRQIERVIRGSKFDLDIIYEAANIDELPEDMETLITGFNLLKYDYIGGSGSRGYGQIKFSDLRADVVVGEVDEDIIDMINDKLENL